jgi:hypothetical protein
MLTSTDYTSDLTLFQEALNQLPKQGMKVTINQNTGNFFYDTWKIKEEYQNTVWKKILDTLPFPIGEARIILLDPGQCYQSHADIDDRYHLSLLVENSFLIDLENQFMYKLVVDGKWYEMDAGKLHSAANFGRQSRIQLVVRKLLQRNQLTDPVHITMKPKTLTLDHSRYVFDNTISSWLNRANKNKEIDNFSHYGGIVEFDTEKRLIRDIEKLSNGLFELIV